MKTIEIRVQGNTYLWNGHTWTDHRFLRPPSKVRHQLTSELIRQLQRRRSETPDTGLVLGAALATLEEGHPEDARRLAQRILKANPKHVEAAAVLGAALRRLRLPRRALEVTAPFERRRNAALLTVRAAAFCDISEWESAHKLIRRAIAIDKAETSPDALKVLARVMSAQAREAA